MVSTGIKQVFYPGIAHWLMVVCCVLPLTLRGQQDSLRLFLDNSFAFQHYGLKQGLSDNTVTAIHQDRDGFLWVGTQDGLNRFDGYSFKPYPLGQAVAGNTFSFTYVTDIHEDRNGNLWVSTLNKGLNKLDRRTGQFISYRSNTGFALYEDRQGIFWIPSYGGLNRFDPQTGRFTLYPHPVPGGYMRHVCQDQSGLLWVGTWEGLYQFDPRSGQFTAFVLDKAHPKRLSIQAMYRDAAGMLWIDVYGVGLYQFDPQRQQVLALYPIDQKGLAGRRIYPGAILQEGGELWLGTDGGLQSLDTRTGQFTTYPFQATRAGSLSSNEVWAVYRDRFGILWVSTNKGLDKLLPKTNRFQTYQFTPDPYYARLPENNTEPVYQDRAGVIWLCNSPGPGGLYRFDRRQGSLRRYPADPANPNGLWSNQVTGDAILEDHLGVLWVGAGDCLHAMDRQTGRFTRYPVGAFFWLIREDIYGKIWIDGGGIASLDRKTGQFTRYRHDPRDSTSLGVEGVSALLASRSGAIWVGGLGISKLDQATGRFIHYRPNATHPARGPNDMIITGFYEDGEGILWIGTGMGGLNRFDPQTETFTAFTTLDGLPSNKIQGITGDASGNLWLATNRGFCRFNPKTKICRTYDESDGLREDEFHFGRVQYQRGELIVHGQNGFTVFFPDSLRDNPRIPAVFVTGFSVFDKPRTFGPDPVELTYRENFLSFDFVALNYVTTEKNQYAYQLVGVDPNWVYSGTRRIASYTNLDPGTYTFRVKGSNNDGVWNEQGAAMQLIILPPWWRTWWFMGTSFLLALGLLYAGFHYRIGQIRSEEAQKTAIHKKEEEQKTEFNRKLSQMEMQALRAQMNPHFFFNCLNSINYFILQNETDVASDYLSKFSRLIRLILQNSDSPTVVLRNELEALDLYLEMEALRFEGKFSYSIRVDSEVDADFLAIPPLIIQPYVENALWHGLMHKKGAGRLRIDLRMENERLVCAIEDDGIGRKRAAELKSKSATRNKSMGMQITSHRLDLIGVLSGRETAVEIMDLVDPAGEPCGTRVVLSIPV